MKLFKVSVSEHDLFKSAGTLELDQKVIFKEDLHHIKEDSHNMMSPNTRKFLGVIKLASLLLFSATLLCISTLSQAQGVGLPNGFSETAIATDIQNPVGMEISQDGRIFVLAGNTRRIEIFDDTGFLNEFIRLPQASSRGSGLLGLEFAPDFAASGVVYIAYVTDPEVVSGPQRFRLSRFNSNGTVADEDSEVVIFEVDDIDPSQQQHQGGDLVIGDDNKIYWALGDRVEGSVVSQPLDSLFGKLLRINRNGTIPADNPFFSDLSGDLRAIYANGLRNPFRMDRRESTGDIYMSEVGPTDWEELNQAIEGANYGWPIVSGVVNDPRFTDPAHAYNHDPDGCAIIGGAFYEPPVNQFPSQYRDKFFYGDHCFGWLAYVDLETGEDIRFMTGADRLVEVKVSPVTGALYYLDREYAGDTAGRSGGVGRIDFVGGTTPLEITRQPISIEAAVGESVSFNVLVTGETPFSYQWFENGTSINGETNASLTLNNVQPSDNLNEFYVQVTDDTGAVEQSQTATLTVSNNSAPEPVITLPAAGDLYIAGEEYTFAGTAFDAEDGNLAADAFHWEIVFHHDEHVHPFIPDAPAIKQGTFVPPINDETDANVWYRIHLTVTDSAGTSTTIEQDIFPLISDVEITTIPADLEVLLDGTPLAAPVNFEGVAGVARVLEAPQAQIVNGQTWEFSSWSNGGNRVQTISTPETDTTFVATYELAGGNIDLLPEAGITAPTDGTTQSSPVNISGIATDDTGIKRVQLSIRNLESGEYWNGSSFVSGWRTVDAVLSSPNSAVTPWSYTFSSPDEIDVRVIAMARQLDGKRGDKERIELSISPSISIEPEIVVTSPEHQSTESNPLLITGNAQLIDLSAVSLLIKEDGARRYWNGSTWQLGRKEVFADLSGGEWSYSLSQSTQSSIIIIAFASDGNGTRIRSDRVQVNIAAP